MMRYADQWWRDQVMATFDVVPGGRLRRPQSQANLYANVAKEVNLPEWPRQEYIDRAVSQLNQEGRLRYFSAWRGWHVPEYEGLYAAELFRRVRELEARLAARDRRGPERGWPAMLISKLEAKAASTPFPAEAESIRAKIDELRGLACS